MKRRAAGLALLVLGLAAWGQGLWIPVKAEVAQVLLEEAWDRTRQGAGATKPWPWADTWPVARLRAPGSGEDLIVLAGATGSTLAFGPGHLTGSATPGDTGHVVIAGHRDTHFAFLRHLAAGDELRLEAPDGGERRYRVQSLAVVDHRDTTALDAGAEGVLTLVTCYPFDAVVPGGPLRYVVRALVVA